MNSMKRRVMMFVLSFVLCMTMLGQGTTPIQAKEKTGYVIKVNKGTNCVTIYDADGKPVKAMICSPSSETPVGTFYTPVKYKWHEMIGNCYAQYCTRIAPEILFHSVWYYKNGDKSSMSVSAYNVMGQKASHGCVRLVCKDAKWIYDNCALQTKVIIFNGTSKDDPLGRPTFTPLTTKSRTSWDPTDPDPKNPYRGLKPKVSAKSKFVEYGSKAKLTELVIIKDSVGNELAEREIKVKVTGKLNTKKLGTYKVTYKVKDRLGKKIVQKIVFKVVDTQKPVISGAKARKNIAMTTTQNVLSGVTAKAVSGKDLSEKIKVSVVNETTGQKVKVKQGNVKFNQAGTYKVTYKVTGTNKKKATKTVKYTVVDRSVKLVVNNSVAVVQGEKFDPMSCVTELKTWKGDVLDIASNVSVTGTVDTNVPGTYKLIFSAANKGIAYTRTQVEVMVTVVGKVPETTAPQTIVPETTAAVETTVQPEQETNSQENTTASEWTDLY